MFMQWKNLEDTKERSKDNPLCICIKYATYLKHFKKTLRFSPNEKKWCDLHMFLSVITWFHTTFCKGKRRVGLWGVQVKWAPKITSTYRPNAITQVQNHSYGKVWRGAYLMAWNGLYHTRCFPIWLEFSLTNTTTKYIF